jgi:hypothetical protein
MKSGNVIETYEHAGEFREWRAVCSHQVTHAIKQLFGLLPPGLVAKTLLRNNWERPFEHEDTNPKHQYGSIRKLKQIFDTALRWRGKREIGQLLCCLHK